MSEPTAEQLQYMQDHASDTRVPTLYGIYVSAIVLAVVSTALRVVAKRYTRHGIWYDDYLCIFAAFCICGESSVNFVTGIPNGYGRHIVVVPNTHAREMISLGDWIFDQWNFCSVWAVKCAVLTFYYRVFPIPTFQKIVIGTLIVHTLYSIAVWGVTTFGCLPVASWWDTSIKGTCINLIPFGIAANLISIISDFWLFLMPIPVVWKLNVDLAKRVLLCCVFAMGLATCILTIFRLITISHIESYDFTWNNVPIAALYVFEPVGGLLCISIPLITRAVHNHVKSSMASNSSPQSNSSPYEEPGSAQMEKKRKNSRWLRGIDSIQLTGLSTRRGSVPLKNANSASQLVLTKTSLEASGNGSSELVRDIERADTQETIVFKDVFATKADTFRPTATAQEITIRKASLIDLERGP